jgi:hypothetical protein
MLKLSSGFIIAIVITLCAVSFVWGTAPTLTCVNQSSPCSGAADGNSANHCTGKTQANCSGSIDICVTNGGSAEKECTYDPNGGNCTGTSTNCGQRDTVDCYWASNECTYSTKGTTPTGSCPVNVCTN